MSDINAKFYKELRQKYNIFANKSLGQHFLFDLNITRKICKLCPNTNNITIIEIGSGPGGLTFALLEAGYKTHVIEQDKNFQPLLTELSDKFVGQLSLSFGDANSIFLNQIINHYKEKIVISNLPYNISVAILTRLLSIPTWQRAILMFQKEVAQRITAKENTKAYGRLSVFSQIIADIEKSFIIKPSAFTPPPKVMSQVLIFKNPKNIAPQYLKNLEIITRHAFGQKRKMLKSSLRNLLQEQTEYILEKNNIDQSKRASDLPPPIYLKLAKDQEISKIIASSLN